MTISFVLTGEILIFPASLANARLMWLKNRVSIAATAATAVDAAADGRVPDLLRQELLRGAGAYSIIVRRDGVSASRGLDDGSGAEPSVTFDLRDSAWLPLIRDALVTLAWPEDARVIAVTDRVQDMGGAEITVVLDERALHAALFIYARNILILSVMLSVLVAGLLFLALNMMLVQPMRQLTQAMLHFAANPEDTRRFIAPSGRRDEIGLAEEQFGQMQRELARLINQKSKLAALGLAVSKISHDLRNMLGSAQLLSDSLAATADPTVQRIAPKLVASLDRAISLCAETLRFGRVREEPRRQSVDVARLVAEVIELAAAAVPGINFISAVEADGLQADADPEHLFRILSNLVRNAAHAVRERPGGGGAVRVTAGRADGWVRLTVADNGPGIAAAALPHLFETWQSTAGADGSGLGLAIARELARAHGGEVVLIQNGPETVFAVTIPDSSAPSPPGLAFSGRAY